jgi:SAM-dependent methyltransferase
MTDVWSERAEAYRQSPAHREGPDLDAIVEWAAGAETALDVATGGGHVARRLREAELVVTTVDPAAGMEPDVVAPAEQLPFADASFDLVFADHGAFTFANPYLAVPEAARVLRPGGLLAFSHSTPIDAISWDEASDSMQAALQAPYFGLHRQNWTEYVTFNLPYGTWIELFRANGLVVEDLIELRPAADAESTYRDDDDRAWARRWPMEQIWKLRKR